MEKPILQIGKVSRIQIFCNIVIALIYLSWWFIPHHGGNIYLYSLLLFGEIFHVALACAFWATIWPSKKTIKPDIYRIKNMSFHPSVDIFVTVAGEPVSVVQDTIRHIKKIQYPSFKIYILNDGFVAKKDNWKDIQALAEYENVECITRKTPGGAKAGNINYGLGKTHGELVVVFDADMKPYPDFLKKTVPYFQDPHLGFVQSPQYYENHRVNRITGGAWEQQEFFFGPVMYGKEKSNSSFLCGTNFVIRRRALEEVGGMNEKNIAEDFLTSLTIHQKKWKSYYVTEVLARGLAPEDLLSYYKQQLRWARGSLEVLFGQNPIFKRGLTWSQRREYLSSALFYFNGVIALIDMLMPIIFLLTGIMPVASTTTSFALFFIPFMAFNLYTLYTASNGSLTFRAISFSQSSWVLQLQALGSVLFRQKMGFSVTSKQAIEGNFLNLVYPHLGYIALAILATGIGLHREGFNPSIITNVAWATFNCIMFLPFIQSSFHWDRQEAVTSPTTAPKQFKHPSNEQLQKRQIYISEVIN